MIAKETVEETVDEKGKVEEELPNNEQKNKRKVPVKRNKKLVGKVDNNFEKDLLRCTRGMKTKDNVSNLVLFVFKYRQNI